MSPASNAVRSNGHASSVVDAPDPSADLDAIEAAIQTLPNEPGSEGEAGRASLVLLRRDVDSLRESYAAAQFALGAALARAADVERERDRAAVEHTASNETLAERVRELERLLAEVRGIEAGFLGEVGAVLHEYVATLDSLNASLRAKAG
jgi:hypothetical protein